MKEKSTAFERNGSGSSPQTVAQNQVIFLIISWNLILKMHLQTSVKAKNKITRPGDNIYLQKYVAEVDFCSDKL